VPVIKVVFYKGSGGLLHKIVRWWTKSKYSHAELIMPDNETWISISPFLSSRVACRKIEHEINEDDWDTLTFNLSFREPVKVYQIEQLTKFINKTKGMKYDWFGMIISNFSPFLIKHRYKWYCSEWIAHALVNSRVIMWDDMCIYSTPNLSPGKLYDILEKKQDV